MELTHPFLDICIDIQSLLNCETLEEFLTVLSSQASINSDHYDRDKYVGDGFELLIEAALKGNYLTKAKIRNYEPVPIEDDTGIDGVGNGFNGHPATVQCKYRENPVYELTGNGDHLVNALAASQNKYGVRIEDKENIFIIHTGKCVNKFTMENMLVGKAIDIGRKLIAKDLDWNTLFWNDFRAAAARCAYKPSKNNRIKLRKHQLEAVNFIKKIHNNPGSKCKVIQPTGTGKSVIIADAIHKISPKITVICSPYILLSHQLLNSVAKYLVAMHGEDYTFLSVNSGKFNEIDVVRYYRDAGLGVRQVKSTTKVDEIIADISKMGNKDRLVISSTYDSASRIRDAGIQVDIQFNDEAHFLVSAEYQGDNDIIQINGATVVNLTATEKITSDSDEGGRGMNSSDLFGSERLYKAPLEMIMAGEIIQPAIHLVSTEDLSDDRNYNAYARCIIESFDRHKEVVEEYSKNPSTIAPKILVTIPSTDCMRGVLHSPELHKPSPYGVPYLHLVHSIVSDPDVGMRIRGNYVKPDKNKFLKALKSLIPTDPAIILQIQMLSTGLDVPGITGTLIFKNLNDTSFIQNTGRACRLSDDDRALLYRGGLKFQDLDNYTKPYAWVIIPNWSRNSSDFVARYRKIISAFKNEFVLDFDNLVIIDDSKSIKESDEEPTTNNPRKIGKADVKELFHSIEDLDILAGSGMFDELALIELVRVIGDQEIAREVFEHVS